MTSSLPLSEHLRDALVEERQRTLAAVGCGLALTSVLESLLRAVEAQFPGELLASILLLDESGERLWHGAAPSLPKVYCEAIDGLKIGPCVGSCGTAAYLGHPVYVTDISTDPLWADFRDLAKAHGLRACWSTPIEGEKRPILGTFAIYHRAPRSPTPVELESIKLITSAAAAAIENHRA